MGSDRERSWCETLSCEQPAEMGIKTWQPRVVPPSRRARNSVVALALLFATLTAWPACASPLPTGTQVSIPTGGSRRSPRGAVPATALSPTTITLDPSDRRPDFRLGLAQAVRAALRSNLQMRLAVERTGEARAVATQSEAPLLPSLEISTSQTNETMNLVETGFTGALMHGLNITSVGPFFAFDSRIKLVQSLINTSATLYARSGREGVRLARLGEQLAAEQVASAVETAYVTLLRARRAVIDARANVSLADSLLVLATRQRDAGIATGLDVTRADTRLSQERVRLAQARTMAQQAELYLEHLTGISLDRHLVLTDPLVAQREPTPPLKAALVQARRQRAELMVARQQLAISKLEVQAARAAYSPTLGLAANYGFGGDAPLSSKVTPVHAVTLELDIPLYNGDLTHGRVMQALSKESQARSRLNDLYVTVDQDVRLAIDTLGTTSSEVDAADHAVVLARRELKMSRDRFRAGLGDNIELLSAQTSLSNARNDQAVALAQYQIARINLAAALGQAEEYPFLPRPEPPSPGTSPQQIPHPATSPTGCVPPTAPRRAAFPAKATSTSPTGSQQQTPSPAAASGRPAPKK